MKKTNRDKKHPATSSPKRKTGGTIGEESFRDIAESTGDAFYRLKYSTKRYDYLSPVIEKLTGYTPDEINEIGFREIVLRIVFICFSPNDLVPLKPNKS